MSAFGNAHARLNETSSSSDDFGSRPTRSRRHTRCKRPATRDGDNGNDESSIFWLLDCRSIVMLVKLEPTIMTIVTTTPAAATKNVRGGDDDDRDAVVVETTVAAMRRFQSAGRRPVARSVDRSAATTRDGRRFERSIVDRCFLSSAAIGRQRSTPRR